MSSSLSFKEKAAALIFGFCALTCVLGIALIILFLAANAWPAFQKIGIIKFLTGTVWKPGSNEYGILPMIVGSVCVSGLAMVFGVPLGIGTAVYIVFFCPKKLKGILKQGVDLLAGIPSVIFGFFGLMILVPFMQQLFGTNGKGVLTAALLLAIMILPTIVSVSVASLQAADPSYYSGSLALGASHERSIYKVVFKAAQSGLLSAIVLGLGRAVGETMAVIMVAGNAAVLPSSILSNVRTLTTNIVMEMGYAQGL
ncbi:MAG: phosphate ABC transporter permease subunit PstC, partial [Erysipelotrichaceae bacterium]|nr:phosphate ABC transporter permease subunit PstC [Erysipelotrichaceae bacterium]